MSIFKTKTLYFAAIGILIMLALTKYYSTPDKKIPTKLKPAVNPYENTVAASGIIESLDQNIAIGVPQAGIVKSVDVVVWQHVKKGQPLFSIDDRELQASLIVQRSNVTVAQATLERVRDQLSRLEAVTDKRAVSQEEVKTRQNDVKVAEAQLQFAQAQVEQTLRLIDRLVVVAPIDGVILQSKIRAGEYVTAIANNDAMTLGNISELQIRADVDEQNASKIVAGLKAVAFPKNNTTLSIPLTFERIEPFIIPKVSLTGASNERVDTRVLQVIYRFKQPENFPVYVGQQVDVFIDTKSDTNGIKNTAALITK